MDVIYENEKFSRDIAFHFLRGYAYVPNAFGRWLTQRKRTLNSKEKKIALLMYVCMYVYITTEVETRQLPISVQSFILLYRIWLDGHVCMYYIQVVWNRILQHKYIHHNGIIVEQILTVDARVTLYTKSIDKFERTIIR